MVKLVNEEPDKNDMINSWSHIVPVFAITWILTAIILLWVSMGYLLVVFSMANLRPP